MDDEYWDGYFDDDPVETDELDEWGCLFGDRCLMPGEHIKRECHTAEMMEALLGQRRMSPESTQSVQISAEEYQVLLAIAQSARILAAGQEREPYYEAEWMRLDGEIIRWVNLPDKKTNSIDSTVKNVLDGINLILRYEPTATIAAEHDVIFFGSYETKDRMTHHEQTQMSEWGWFEECESWAKHV